MLSEEEAEIVEETGTIAADTSFSIISSNFITNVLMAGSLTQVWSIINALQIIGYLQLLKVKTPGNATSFNSFFVELSSFEIIPVQTTTQELFYFPEVQYMKLNL